MDCLVGLLCTLPLISSTEVEKNKQNKNLVAITITSGLSVNGWKQNAGLDDRSSSSYILNLILEWQRRRG